MYVWAPHMYPAGPPLSPTDPSVVTSPTLGYKHHYPWLFDVSPKELARVPGIKAKTITHPAAQLLGSDGVLLLESRSHRAPPG